jgi:hypothetical protein
MRALLLPLAAAALLLPAACQKEKTPKVDAATEQAEALERARKGPMGAQVQALDKAKALEADMNAKAAANLEKADPK